MYKHIFLLVGALWIVHGARYFDPDFRLYRKSARALVAVNEVKAEVPDPVRSYGTVQEPFARASQVVTGPYRDWAVGEPRLSASYAYAADIETGYVFYQKGDVNASWPIASISKLMMALVAEEERDGHERVFVSEAAVATEGIAGGLVAGDEYTAKDLVAIMLLTSSNDAAMALAEHIGKDGVGPMMQEKASEIGMLRSIFIEPTGLSEANRSTLSDLKIFMRYLYEAVPATLTMTALPAYEVVNHRTGYVRTIYNINRFAGRSDFLGGKTGFIDTSGENLVSLFRYRNYTIMTGVLGSSDRFGDTERVLEFIKEGYRF